MTHVQLVGRAPSWIWPQFRKKVRASEISLIMPMTGRPPYAMQPCSV